MEIKIWRWVKYGATFLSSWLKAVRICSFTTSDKLCFFIIKNLNKMLEGVITATSSFFRSPWWLNLIKLNLERKHYPRLLFCFFSCRFVKRSGVSNIPSHKGSARLSLCFMDICSHRIHPPRWLARLGPSITVSNGRGPRALWSHGADISSRRPSHPLFYTRLSDKTPSISIQTSQAGQGTGGTY